MTKYAPRRLITARSVYDRLVDELQERHNLPMTREELAEVLPFIITLLSDKMFIHDDIYRDNEFLMWLSKVADEHIQDRTKSKQEVT